MKIPLRQYWALFSTYLRPLWLRVVLLAVLIFGGIGLQLVNPQILRFFIDTARSHGAMSSLLLAAGVFVGVVVVQQALNVWATYVSENLAWTSTNALRHDLARHCLDLDMGFHNIHTPGELIERIDGDVTLLANFFSEFVLQLVGSGLLILGVLLVLFGVDWRIGGAMTLYCLAVMAILNRLRGISVPYWIKGRQASADMAGFLEERLAGTEDIRSSRATDFVMGQFYRLMRQILLTYRMAHMTSVLAAAVSRFSFIVGLTIGLGLGGWLYLHGSISLGTVYMVSYYAGILSWPLFQITDQIDDLQQASAGLARVNALFAVPASIADGPGARPPAGPLTIEFDGVTFAYRPDCPGPGSSSEPVLKNVSFQVGPGEVLGLLGRTGSGKTTISRLLFRLYDPQSGRICLSGTDICSMRLADLRRRIGLVTQEVQLFHASVRDNLTFFDREISDGRILEAIETLGLDAWYRSLPDGLDTQLRGSGGLSAGEAQVLALTRVFLKQPDVVVLDEASSRLDPATEQLIEHAVDTLLRGRTAIVIAHRLGTVRRADSILILSEGSVLEYGPRAALAADPDSHFAQLLRTGLELEPAGWAGGRRSEAL
jgi:ABC-type multidrug transport system fused ATPase/permease subunit